MATSCTVCSAKTDAYLCRKHGQEIAVALGNAKSLMHELSNVATGQTRVYRGSGRRGHDPESSLWDVEQAKIAAMLRSREGRITLPSTAAVVNLDARELLWEAGNTLSTWCRDLAARVGISLTCECSPPSAPCVLIPGDWLTWMTDNADTFRFHEAAEQAHDEITYLHRRMVAAVDRTPSPLFAGPCHASITEPVATERGGTIYIEMTTHRCERDLYAWPDADGITCDGTRAMKATEAGNLVPDHDDEGCGTEHTFADRQTWLVKAAQEQLIGVDEMLGALPTMFPTYPQPPRGVVLAWIRQGRLMAHGQNPLGEPTFVGGEILELIAAYKPHKYAPRPNRRTA